MATDESIRASDSDREVVVAALREAYTAGRLTLDEFDERMTSAYAGKTWGDLRTLTEDLPAQPVLGGDIPGRAFPVVLAEIPAPIQLPVHPPPPSATTPTRRRSSIPILIPVAVWTVLALHAGGTGTGFVVLSMVLLAVLLSAFRRR